MRVSVSCIQMCVVRKAKKQRGESLCILFIPAYSVIPRICLPFHYLRMKFIFHSLYQSLVLPPMLPTSLALKLIEDYSNLICMKTSKSKWRKWKAWSFCSSIIMSTYICVCGCAYIHAASYKLHCGCRGTRMLHVHKPKTKQKTKTKIQNWNENSFFAQLHHLCTFIAEREECAVGVETKMKGFMRSKLGLSHCCCRHFLGFLIHPGSSFLGWQRVASLKFDEEKFSSGWSCNGYIQTRVLLFACMLYM